jgi:hypothetical protein
MTYIDESDGRLVEPGMTEAHAITLASTLNTALRAAQRRMQQRRKPPQPT